MASRNPNQRSSKPKPLANPRTNPLETKSRSPGELSSSGLSVHFGVQGRIRSSTPQVAHKVTNNNARRWCSHIREFPAWFSAAEGREMSAECLRNAVGWSLSDLEVGAEMESEAVTGGMVLGSAVTRHSRKAGCAPSRMDSVPSSYSTA